MLFVLPRDQQSSHTGGGKCRGQYNHFPSTATVAFFVQPAVKEKSEGAVVNVSAQKHVLNTLVRDILFVEDGLTIC